MLILTIGSIFLCITSAAQVNIIPVCNCDNSDRDATLKNVNISVNIAFGRGSDGSVIQSDACGLTLPRDPHLEYGDSFEGEFPWFTSIYKANFKRITFECAATLISKTGILTSAACIAGDTEVRPEKLLVFVGAYHFIEFGGYYQQRKVKKVVLHPQFDYLNLENDLAILILETQVQINDYVRPVCLWTSDPPQSSLIGKELIHPGWDYNPNDYINDRLTYISMPIIPNNQCGFEQSNLQNFQKSKSLFCATFHADAPTCKGDEGAGLVMKYNGVWYIRGIDSASIGGQDEVVCNNKHYAAITNIVPFITWIRQNI